MNFLARITQSLTMKYQALILQGIICIFVILGLYCIQSWLQQITVELVSQTSHNVLIKHNNALMTILASSIQNFLNQAFNQVYQSINKTQIIYTNILGFQSIYDLQYCPVKVTNDTLKLGKPLSHCVANNLETVNRSSQYYINYKNAINLVDQFLISFHLQNNLGSHTTFRIEYPHLVTVYAVNQQGLLFPGYNVETRPFWKEYFSQAQDRYIVDPFFNLATSQRQIMVLQKVFNSSKLGELLVGVAIDFNVFNQYLKLLPNTMLILCTLKGVIIASNIKFSDTSENTNQLTDLLNQSFIPITKDDWIEIKNYVYQRNYSSNCNQNVGEFCRILNDTDVQIEAKLLQQRLVLIVQYLINILRFNNLTFTKNERNLLKSNQEIMVSNTYQIQILCFIVCIPFIIVSLIYFSKILHPITNMINSINLVMKTEFQNVENNNVFNNMNMITAQFQDLKNAIKHLIYRHIKYRFLKINYFNQHYYPQKIGIIHNINFSKQTGTIKRMYFSKTTLNKVSPIKIEEQFKYKTILQLINKAL